VNEKKVGDDYARERDVKDQDAQLDVLNRKREADRRHYEAQKDAELRHMERKLAMYRDSSVQALAAALDGPEAERLLRLEELRTQERMTPEQLLFFVAAKSPDVARAMAKKYEAEGLVKNAQFEKMLAEQKAEIVDGMANKAMQNVADVAEGRAIGPGALVCPSCGRTVERRYNFCPHCQAALAGRKGS
jgi:rubrerythrin